MAEALFSPFWYRVARLRPRLRGHTRVHRHEYRGELWYVLQDHAKGQFYRFTPETYEFIGRMNGKRSVQDLWEAATETLGDRSLTQDEVVRLLGQLHSSDVLLCDVPPDTAELLRRAQKVERQQWLQKLRSPLAIKIPLIDPDRFLTRTAWLARPLFSWFGALLWLVVVATGIGLAALHWEELTSNIVDRVLSARTLLTALVVYPVIKAFHELGHGYAVKTWGGEVHEMGIMFLVFMPVPYVDASAASEFRAKHRRVIVGAAGILVEVFLASLAMILWAEMEPGSTARSVAYSAVLIGSISTVLFNGNPLLRYDGYYVLGDLLEISNLAKRGSNYLAYLVKRHGFGQERARAPYAGPGEPFWFVGYTIAAFIYRMFVYTAIVLFLASKLFFVGILLAMWAAFSMIVLPLFKGAKYVLTDAGLRDKRSRAVLVSVAGIGVLAALLFAVPVPLRTRIEGVVWPPQEALVRAATSGFVKEVVATPNGTVEQGELLIDCYEPLLAARGDVLRARMAELQSRYDAARANDRVQAQIVEREMAEVGTELSQVDERLTALAIRSPRTGRFILPEASDLPARYVAQGDLLAFVLDVHRPIIRVVVPQSRVGLVRHDSQRVEVRMAEQLERIVPAVIEREVPEAEQRLPSTILGSVGGGEIAIDPTEESGTRTFERLFQFDVELQEPVDDIFVGGRAYVLFDHGYEPIGWQWYRRLRQLFLRRFNV